MVDYGRTIVANAKIRNNQRVMNDFKFDLILGNYPTKLNMDGSIEEYNIGFSNSPVTVGVLTKAKILDEKTYNTIKSNLAKVAKAISIRNITEGKVRDRIKAKVDSLEKSLESKRGFDESEAKVIHDAQKQLKEINKKYKAYYNDGTKPFIPEVFGHTDEKIAEENKLYQKELDDLKKIKEKVEKGESVVFDSRYGDVSRENINKGTIEFSGAKYTLTKPSDIDKVLKHDEKIHDYIVKYYTNKDQYCKREIEVYKETMKVLGEVKNKVKLPNMDSKQLYKFIEKFTATGKTGKGFLADAEQELKKEKEYLETVENFIKEAPRVMKNNYVKTINVLKQALSDWEKNHK